MMGRDKNRLDRAHPERAPDTTSRLALVSRAVRLVVLAFILLGVIAVVQFFVTFDYLENADYRAVREMFGTLLGVAAGIPLIGSLFYQICVWRERRQVDEERRYSMLAFERMSKEPWDTKTRIFERFYRIEMGGNGAAGTELGLAIAKDFIERQGGRTEVESKKGQGSAFTVSLPLQPATLQERAPTVMA